MVDLVIKNGLVITPSGSFHGGLAIANGIIVDIGADSTLPQGREEYNAEGRVIFPGLIEPHAHIGLGLAQDEAKFKSDIATESVTAAVNGITTIHTTMGIGLDPLANLNPFVQCREIGEAYSLVDFKFTGVLLTDSHLEEIPRAMKAGITSFKLPLAYIGPEGRHFGITGFDLGFVYKSFEAIARVGPPAMPMIHAEESAVIEVLIEKLKAEGRTDIKAWSEARPNIAETMHVFACGLMAMELGAPLYVVHVSAKESVDAIRYFKERGVRVYGETCPHYIAPITKDSDLGTIAKVNPPLRDEADCERLWQGINDGDILTIGSDHCIYNREDKESAGLWDSIVGFSGMGAILPIMITRGVKRGRITFEQMARVCAENSAKLFGIYPRKGALIPGADADIVVIDPDEEWVLSPQTLKQASDFSIWDGYKVQGRAVRTYVRGRLVAQDGEPVEDNRCGKYVMPVLQPIG